MQNFALIGASGYIAPRHMQAIRETGNRLVAALDPNDSVGIIDNYFPDAHFFTEFERFDRHVERLRRSASADEVRYVTICSPNYLHDAHARYALRAGAHAICEKPLVMNPWNIDGLIEMEKNTGQRVFTILQLRVHPTIVALQERLVGEQGTRKHEVDLSYITSRGRWYLQSWKADVKKSGGIATNIGIHFFDLLHFLFGELQENIVHVHSETRAGGYLEYERARVRWFLSIEESDIPAPQRQLGRRTFRSITMDGLELEFSDGFADLHTRSYERILAGQGFGVECSRSAISAVSAIRSAQPIGLVGDFHPALTGPTFSR